MVPGGSPESFGAGLCSAFGPSTVSNAFRLITAHMQALRNRSSEQTAASSSTSGQPEGSKRLDDAGGFASLFKLAKLSGRQPKTPLLEAAVEALQPVSTTVANNAAHVIELRNTRGAKLNLKAVRVALKHPEKYFPNTFNQELPASATPHPSDQSSVQQVPTSGSDQQLPLIDWSTATGVVRPSKWPSADAKRTFYAANTPSDAIAYLKRVALVGGFDVSYLELGLNKQSSLLRCYCIIRTRTLRTLQYIFFNDNNFYYIQ